MTAASATQAPGRLSTYLAALTWKIGATVAGVVATLITARALGPSDRGALTQLLIALGLAATIGGLGRGEAYLYHRRVSGGADRASLLASCVPMSLLAAIAAPGLLLAFAAAGGPSSPGWWAWAAAAGLFAGLGRMGLSLAKLDTSLATFNRMAVLQPMLFLAGTLALLAIDAVGLGEVAAVYALSLIAPGLWSVRLCLREAAEPPVSFPRPAWRRLALKGWMTELFAVASLQADKVVVMALLGVADLGVYSVAATLTIGFSVIQDGLANTVLARASGSPLERVWPEVRRAWGLYLGAGALLLGAMAAFAGPALWALLGPGYAGVEGPLLVLAAAAFIGGASWILATTFACLGRPELVLARQVVGVAVTLALAVPLAREHGLTGIAWATFAGASARLLLGVALLRLRFNMAMKDLILPVEGRAALRIMGRACRAAWAPR